MGKFKNFYSNDETEGLKPKKDKKHINKNKRTKVKNLLKNVEFDKIDDDEINEELNII